MEPAEPGRLIAGRYRLRAVIGRGGMGVVWKAHDELLSREVAAKELAWPVYFSAAEQRAACRRAAREARVAARLNHPNVVRVLDIAEEDGCPWIVMELLPRRSLREVIEEEGPLSPAGAARVGLGVLAALRAAHAEGIVHRDVKPANILLAPDRVVLTDFGIAQAAWTSELTTAGMLIGSPAYIAPERARGGQSGPPGDLWGLGASLYAAVEGRAPFDGEGGALACLVAVVADEPEPPARAGPLGPVISGLLRKDPAERLGIAEAERMLRNVDMAPPAPASAMTPQPRRPHRLAATLAGSAALIVIAASGTAVGLTLTRSSQPATAAAAGITPSAAAIRPPAATAPHTPAAIPRPRTRMTAPTSRAGPPPSSRAAPAAASSGARHGGGSAVRGWLAAWAQRFAHYLPGRERRPHPAGSRDHSSAARRAGGRM